MSFAQVATSAAKANWKNLMRFSLSIFRIGFNSSKCKTAAKMTIARIKLLRNKRQAVVKQMRRDVSLLLQSGEDATARIRVEHVIREQNMMAANEFLELFCELIVSRLSIIKKQRDCPADLKEGISSLIFAAPRCPDIPELVALRDIFEKKYGKDFVSAATDLRPSCGVNSMLIDKLSVRRPSGEVKLKVMKEIGKEYQIEWDASESEVELLKPPEERIEGPKTFVSASSMPVNPVMPRAMQSNGSNKPFTSSYSGGGERGRMQFENVASAAEAAAESNKPFTSSYSGGGERGSMQFENVASAAEAAAESANKAIAAAQAAAYLANRDSTQAHEFDTNFNASRINHGYGDTLNNIQNMGQGRQSGKPESFERSYSSINEVGRPTNIDDSGKVYRRHSYNVAPSSHSDINRRHSYNAGSAHSDIKFDESDCDEEIEMEAPHLPPDRIPPPVPSSYVKQDSASRVHPKLPDYDTLSARFEALKSGHKPKN